MSDMTRVLMAKECFEEPLDFTQHIDVYFNKQEKCQKIAEDAKVPILGGIHDAQTTDACRQDENH